MLLLRGATVLRLLRHLHRLLWVGEAATAVVAACCWVRWDSILLVAVVVRWVVDRRRHGLATRVVILVVAALRRCIVGC